MTDIHTTAQAQFARTAAAYKTSSIHAKGEDFSVLLAVLGDVAGKQALDIATGAGHTALALARAGAQVLATDLTPEMLQVAESFINDQTDAATLEISFQLANAEDLPFEDNQFELVTCRIAAHHFASPAVFIHEVARVLAPGGTFVLIDNIAPAEPQLAEVMNEIERRRDPSHVEAYTISRWISWLHGAQLEPFFFQRWHRTKVFQAWVNVAQTPDDAADELERYILALPHEQQQYFQVVVEDGRLLRLSHEVMLLCAHQRYGLRP